MKFMDLESSQKQNKVTVAQSVKNIQILDPMILCSAKEVEVLQKLSGNKESRPIISLLYKFS